MVTRWRPCRQSYRSLSWARVKSLLVMTTAAILYGLVFFKCQPDRSYATIVAQNLAAEESQKNRRSKSLVKPEGQTSTTAGIVDEGVGETFSQVDPQGFNATTVSNKTNEASLSASPSQLIAQKGDSGKPSFLFTTFSWLAKFYALAILLRLYVHLYVLPRIRQQGDWPIDPTLRRDRFQAWVRRLNQQRLENGQPPMSAESLWLVMQDRDLNGDDYEELLQFDEEAGPAVEASMSPHVRAASPDEINRLPRRKLSENDDLVRATGTVRQRQPNQHEPLISDCAICLEPYRAGEVVTTIPCFHTFHKACIDPWLSTKSVCPICKHPAIT